MVSKDFDTIEVHCIVLYCITRGCPCQHRFMCGCKQWSNDINESNYNMQPITIIKFAVRVGAYIWTNTDAPCMFILAMFGW